MNSKQKLKISLLSLVVLMTACVSIKPNLRVAQASYCAPARPAVYDQDYLPLRDLAPILKRDSLILKKFSYQDLLLANASGSFYLLRDLIHMQQTVTNDDDDSLVFLLVKKQEIFNRLILSSTEVAGVAAELDCESERAKQSATFLDQMNDTRIQRLTILSVVSGAITAIGTSAIKNNDAQISFGITGSIVSAVFGGLAAISSKRTIDFKHKRNLLSDVWLEPETSAMYPPFIWFVLRTKEFNDDAASTIKSLKERWIADGLLNPEKNPDQINLLFGPGGNYQSGDLHTRADMINQLKAEIRSINQNLQYLMLKLSV